MPSFELEFEAYCECGEGMCSNVVVTATHKRGHPCIVITPCKKCLEVSFEEGVEEGSKDE